jgi:hypothetical protein
MSSVGIEKAIISAAFIPLLKSRKNHLRIYSKKLIAAFEKLKNSSSISS